MRQLLGLKVFIFAAALVAAQSCPKDCKSCKINSACETCMSGFYLQNYHCNKCEESDCDLCPGNRCSQCLDGYKLTESGRCLSLGSGVLYLAGAIIGLLFITVAAIFCCLYNWKKIKAFFNQHFKTVAESQRGSSGSKNNKVVPASSQHKSTSNLDESKMPIVNASNDEEQVQFKVDTSTNPEGKESKAALSGAPDIGLNKLGGEQEQMTLEKKPPEDRILKKADHGKLSARNNNSGSDWKLGEDASAKRGISKVEPTHKQESESEEQHAFNISKSSSKKSIVKFPVSAHIDKNGATSDRSNLQISSEKQRQFTGLQQKDAPLQVPNIHTQQIHIDDKAKQEPDCPNSHFPTATIPSKQPVLNRLDNQPPLDMPVMASNSTPKRIAATASIGGSLQGAKAVVTQEKPSGINKTLPKDEIPQLSPTETNLRNEPNLEKPAQSSFSKSKHAEDSLQRETADEFIDGLFASIVEQF